MSVGQQRQPKGVPVGGQFAASAKGESGVALVVDNTKPKPPGYWTQETFLAHAKEIHGGTYDYSSVEFVDMRTKVVIVCAVHGEFCQPPSTHIYQQSGCTTCGRTKGAPRLDTEQFIAKARSVHGDTYQYDLVRYERNDKVVLITCAAHGTFEQRPDSHLVGKGCRECGIEKNRAARRSALDEVVQAARQVHGERYDYSGSTYLGLHTPMAIVCPTHGRFDQTPANHIHGKQNCPDCAALTHGKWSRISHDEFMARVLDAQGDRYDFSKTHYLGSDRKVVVTCRRHGDFPKWPDHLAAGSGCPSCMESAGERTVAAILDAAGLHYEREFRHPTLRDRRGLRFDFALPTHRVLIEFDGEQHRRPVTFGMSTEAAEEQFKNIQRRDAIKTSWAAANGWRLIRLTDTSTVEADLVNAGIITAARPG